MHDEPQAGKVAKEQPIPAMLSQIASVDEDLAHAIDRLEARLAPILGEPLPVNETQKPMNRGASEISGSLARVTMRLEEHLERINHLANRVEC